ncbi:MAG: hypothetical protein LBQ54_02760 [Planctomycetaceae bacterium]|jgi:hypothetical protein|nr:hypothetical protein [Planctomycetaceae bacterium]
MEYKESINQELVRFFEQHTKDGFTVILNDKNFKKLPKPLQSQLGFTSKTKSTDKRARLKPHLGQTLDIRKNGNSNLLYLRMPDEELVYKMIAANPSKSPGKILFGLTNPKKAAVFNKLAAEGKIRMEVNAKLTVNKLYPMTLPEAVPTVPPAAVQETECSESRKTELKAAYDRLISGKYFVRICDLRYELKWDRNIFDTVLESLRQDYLIQLEPGDTLKMTDQEVKDSYIDHNHTLYLDLRWR